MSSFHKCPFCQEPLRLSEDFINKNNIIKPEFNHYFCDETACMIDDMPRYSVNYSWGKNKEDNKKISCSFAIDTCYVQIDWEENITTLSTLYSAILLDSVIIQKALDFDMNNLSSVTERIKTLLVFS